MSFNLIPGSSQYLISAAGAMPLNSGTVAGWFAPDFLATATTAYTFWGSATGDVSLIKNTTTMQLLATVDGRTAVQTIPTAWVAATWHHFAMRYNKTAIAGWPADTIDVFIDGVKCVGAAKAGTWGANVPAVMHIGSAGIAGDYFDGKVAEVATWSTPLTDNQINALASQKNPLTVNPEYLVEYWPLTSTLIRWPRFGNIYLALGATPLVNADHPYIEPPPQYYDLYTSTPLGFIRFVPPWTLGLEAFDLKAASTTRHLSNKIRTAGFRRFRFRVIHCGLTEGTVGALSLTAKMFAADKISNLLAADWISLSTAHPTVLITGNSSVSLGDFAPTAIGCTINAEANSYRFGAFTQIGAYITTASDLAVGYGSVSMEMAT